MSAPKYYSTPAQKNVNIYCNSIMLYVNCEWPEVFPLGVCAAVAEQEEQLLQGLRASDVTD